MNEFNNIHRLPPLSYFSIIDTAKESKNFPYGNIFLNARDIKKLIDRKNDSLFFNINNDAFALLIPRHQKYYELFFQASSLESLNLMLKYLTLPDENIGIPIVVSIIEKKEKINYISEVFSDNNFKFQKKLQRTKSKSGMSFLTKQICGSFQNDLYNYVEFASKGDENEIINILNSIFDIYKDNIPEIDDIKNAIENKEILIIRYKHKIISLHYFSINNHVYHGLFDATLKEYRNRFTFFNIVNYFHNYIKNNNILVIRSYGWRDLENKRLLRFAKNMDQPLDNIYLYNMIYRPGSFDND